MSDAESLSRTNSPLLAELLQNGNDVTRWHTFPNLLPQNVAAHSWGVAMIVMSLYPNTPEKMLMVQVALEHDLIEKYIGDMPRPARTAEHRRLEESMAHEKSIFHESMLNLADRNWLAWADLIEAGLHARREHAAGNSRYQEVIQRVSEYIKTAGTEVPLELRIFAEHAGVTV
jgi:5'-deoxynucleotidase YfbR-like HD superfamily hydrolase